MLDIVGYHLGARLDIAFLKQKLKFKCVYHDQTELIYEEAEHSYILVNDYGSVVFLGISKKKEEAVLKKIEEVLGVKPLDLDPEYYLVEVNARSSYKVLFDRIVLKKLNFDIAKVLMLGISESIALDHYMAQSEKLLEEILVYTNQLEKKGSFSIRGKSLFKYIGKTMHLKNKIVSNLYIFDTPNAIWDDEQLDKIRTDLNRELDIAQRYRSLQDNLETIKESLDFFNDFHQHLHSSRLEWIIIILILFEIVKPLLDKTFA